LYNNIPCSILALLLYIENLFCIEKFKEAPVAVA
jgi:hypothetical protein